MNDGEGKFVEIKLNTPKMYPYTNLNDFEIEEEEQESSPILHLDFQRLLPLKLMKSLSIELEHHRN